MAPAAWKFYNKFKEYMADNTIDLDGATFNMNLYLAASNASTDTLSTKASLTNELASANGYVTAGKTLAVTWATGASAGEMRFDATAEIWTASGGNLGNSSTTMFAVIHDGTRLVCWSKLSTAGFTVTDGNTLTITPAATGIFELNGPGA